MKKCFINKEGILKFFIVIGLLAILISLYIQYIGPFLSEIKKEKRDKTRIQNISLLNSVLEEIKKNNSNLFLGEPNTIYVSLPSNNSDCRDLKLPSLPNDWKYACKNKETLQKIDGSGWLPIDFTKASGNTSLGASLPVDPLKAPTNEYYYSYVAGNGFALTSLLESNKNIKLFVLKDNGIDSSRFEVGSPELLKQLALIRGLRGYWITDKQIDTDKAFIDRGGEILDDSVVGKALNFKNAGDFVMIKDHPAIQNIFSNGGSISVWIYPKSSGKTTVGRIAEKYNEKAGWILYVYFSYGSAETVRIGFLQRFFGNVDWKTGGDVPIGFWSHIVVTYNNSDLINNPIIYINGKRVDIENIAMSLDKSASDGGIDLYIGNDRNLANAFDGYIGETRIYDRILTDQEIFALYKNLPSN